METNMVNDLEVEDAELVEEPSTEVKDTKPDLKVLLAPARYKDESFADYKIRRAAGNRAIKTRLKNGTMFHNSKDRNTYQKGK